jgi:hypothetical protein
VCPRADPPHSPPKHTPLTPQSYLTAPPGRGSSSTPISCAWERRADGRAAAAAAALEKRLGRGGGGGGGAGVDTLTCTISAAEGSFEGAPLSRAWTWRFLATLPPSRVTIDGVEAPRDAGAAPDAWGDGAAWSTRGGAPGGWDFCGATLSTWVSHAAPTPRGAATEVVLTWPPGVRALSEPALTAGIPRTFARAQVRAPPPPSLQLTRAAL